MCAFPAMVDTLAEPQPFKFGTVGVGNLSIFAFCASYTTILFVSISFNQVRIVANRRSAACHWNATTQHGALNALLQCLWSSSTALNYSCLDKPSSPSCDEKGEETCRLRLVIDHHLEATAREKYILIPVSRTKRKSGRPDSILFSLRQSATLLSFFI